MLGSLLSVSLVYVWGVNTKMHQLALLLLFLLLAGEVTAECAIVAPRRDAGPPTYRVLLCETSKEYFQRIALESAKSIRGYDKLNEQDLALHIEIGYEQDKKGWRDSIGHVTVSYEGFCKDVPLAKPVDVEFYAPILVSENEQYGCCDGMVTSVGCYYDYKIRTLSLSP